jgi:hypothetical protein
VGIKGAAALFAEVVRYRGTNATVEMALRAEFIIDVFKIHVE